jgi:hypothetical protein
MGKKFSEELDSGRYILCPNILANLREMLEGEINPTLKTPKMRSKLVINPAFSICIVERHSWDALGKKLVN